MCMETCVHTKEQLLEVSSLLPVGLRDQTQVSTHGNDIFYRWTFWLALNQY